MQKYLYNLIWLTSAFLPLFCVLFWLAFGMLNPRKIPIQYKKLKLPKTFPPSAKWKELNNYDYLKYQHGKKDNHWSSYRQLVICVEDQADRDVINILFEYSKLSVEFISLFRCLYWRRNLRVQNWTTRYLWCVLLRVGKKWNPML